MCGIAGVSLSNRTQKVDMDALSRSLLLGIEERGRDATGIAWHDETDHQVWIQKDPVRASDFVGGIETRGARSCILHTRFGTKGSETNNANNHPIEHHGIVGVHNGIIYNDDDIFAMLDKPKRHGKVDSEAIFALIARSGEPVEEVLPLIEGSAAIAWLNVNDEPGTLHLARIASSPLYVAQTRLGSTVFASTKKCVLEASLANGFKVEYVNEIPEGSYLKVVNGRIEDVRTFEKPGITAPARTRYYNANGTKVPGRTRVYPASTGQAYAMSDAGGDDWDGVMGDDDEYEATYGWLGEFGGMG